MFFYRFIQAEEDDSMSCYSFRRFRSYLTTCSLYLTEM